VKARWIGVVAVAIAIAIWLLWPAQPDQLSTIDPPAPAPKREVIVEDAPTSAPRATKAGAAAAVVAPRPDRPSFAPMRIALPRPTSDPESPRFVLAEEKRLKDKRDGVRPGAEGELETIGYGLDTLHEDVDACLKEWRSKSATISGSVRLAFQLDPSGLTTAWLIGGEALPFGPRTCIGNAAYGIDWSNIVDHASEVTDDFDLAPSEE
jgi:hypothetical protein